MENKYQVLIKDTFIFSIGKFGSRAVLFFLVPLYTNYLSQGEYGTADLVFTVSQLLTPIFSIVIFDSIVRFGLMKSQLRENVLLNGFIIWLFCVGLSSFSLIIFSFYENINEWKYYLSLLIVLTVAMNIEMNFLKVEGKNFAYSLISIAQSAALALLNILFLVKLSLGVEGYLLSTVLSYLTCVVLAFLCGNVWNNLKKSSFDRKLFKEMILYSFPLILNNISWWVIQSSNKLMLEAMISVSALGLYTAASKIPSLINVLISVFQQSWGISSIREIESTNDTKFYSNVLLLYSTLVFGCCILLNLIIKPFMFIYVGKEFREAWHYAPLLVASAGFSAMSAYFGSMYGALKKSMNNMLTTVLAAVVNISVCFSFINILGIWGAIIGTIISYIFIAYVRMINVSKYVKLDINWKVMISNSLIVVIQSIMVTLNKYTYLVSILCIILFSLINMNSLKILTEKIKLILTRKSGLK